MDSKRTLEELRREAEHLLNAYQAAQDAEDMRRLSSRYEQIATLLESAEDAADPRPENVSALEDVPLPKTPPGIRRRVEAEERGELEEKPSSRPDTPPVKKPRGSLLKGLQDALKRMSVDVPLSSPVTPEKPIEQPEPPKTNKAIPDTPRPSNGSLRGSRNKKRTCPHCQQETRFDDETCEHCGNIDKSLNILNEVIAGNVQRVKDILLAKPHVITTQTRQNGWTLLHMAASSGNVAMVELLITKGVSVNARSTNGKTALHYAASRGYADIVDILLKNHADPTIRYKGKTALDLARHHGKIVELLQNNVDA